MKMRTIKATFEISEDSGIGGLSFSYEDIEGQEGRIKIESLTKKEVEKMLNCWARMYELVYNAYFKEGKEAKQ